MFQRSKLLYSRILEEFSRKLKSTHQNRVIIFYSVVKIRSFRARFKWKQEPCNSQNTLSVVSRNNTTTTLVPSSKGHFTKEMHERRSETNTRHFPQQERPHHISWKFWAKACLTVKWDWHRRLIQVEETSGDTKFASISATNDIVYIEIERPITIFLLYIIFEPYNSYEVKDFQSQVSNVVITTKQTDFHRARCE